MPSANKTPHLGLNNWCGTDKPKCSDFVQDNQLIDAALHAHSSDTDLHLSAQERDRLNQLVSTGFYIGTGNPERTLALSFTPSFALVFRSDGPLLAGGSENRIFLGAASQNYASAGISLSGSVLTVSQANGANLNASGETYGYLLLR